MKINIPTVPDEGLDIEDIETIEQEAGRQVKARLKLRVDKAGRDVFVRGEAAAGLSLTCSRCLKEFESEISFPVELAFLPEEEAPESEEGHELAPDEMNTVYYKDDEIDLGEVAKEQLLLNLPMKPLCSEACKGICPGCGAKLDEEACRCEGRKIDPRLEVLKKYLKDRKE